MTLLPLLSVDDPDLQFNFDQIALVVGRVTQYGTWQSPSLSNSWVAYGGAYAPAGYVKDNAGFVHLRGAVKNGSAANAVMFTLPAGFRPAYTSPFAAIAFGGTLATIEVNAAGDVYANAGGSTTLTALDGVVFRAEQ